MTKTENKFNDLGPKEWLPFQKSFTIFENMEKLIEKNIDFFTKASLNPKQTISSIGTNQFKSLFKDKAEALKLKYELNSKTFDFLAIDLTENSIPLSSALEWIIKNGNKLNNRKFLWILIPTDLWYKNEMPYVWYLSEKLSDFLTRKDEKIICLPNGRTWTSLYFRKDEKSKLNHPTYLIDNQHLDDDQSISNSDWFFLKPKPRSSDEVLHPAKYPEDLVKMYVEKFTKLGDTIFDPMSGTGTTQVTSLELGRKTFGIELNQLFHQIAIKRCEKLNSKTKWKIFQGDARDFHSFQIPNLDYIITSPPYWDMLNMKGAEIQASRIAKGLNTNYSDDINDLGNINNYSDFLNILIDIYIKTCQKLKNGGHITIVVKNVKKKGVYYPLAFDITKLIKKFLKFKHVGFWCQNDLQIAPYGYKHTWVSNTFHHYCITFQKA